MQTTNANRIEMYLTLISTFIIAIVLTGLIRRYAFSQSLIDIPNERSSHDVPVPRGGGLVIVLSCLVCVFLAGRAGLVSRNEVIALIGGGGLVAIIGWLDDHRDVPALFRAFVHFIAAIWTVSWLGGLVSIELGSTTIEPGWFGSMLAVIGIVWLINLYNFMDGTDGIAAVQAIVTAGFAAFLFFSADLTGLVLITMAMLGATAGFLLWNWSPAKIFMGDVGSGFLGYFFAALAILGEKTGSVPLLIWSILLALFFWDATLTLFYRIRARETWYAAHRSHAYQRFVQMGHSHGKLAAWVFVINVSILWPIAWIAMNYKTSMLVLAFITVILCAVLWVAIRYKYDKHSR